MWHVWGKIDMCIHTVSVGKTGRKGPFERLVRCNKEDGRAGTGLMGLKSEMYGGFL
jgi:hypothetical protein